MYLVAGLAVAGLAGIAAAFYFSIRSGNGGNKRLRPAGTGRARAGRTGHARHVVYGSRPARSGGTARASSRDYQAEDDTGPNPAVDSGDPALTGGQRGSEAGNAAKPRRRMGFRKGADVDEELWPTEAFGGVSDEQFWDDLASDRPLTTTARTAHQDSGPRKRPPENGAPTDPQAPQAKREDRSREDRVRGNRVRENRGRGDGRRGPGAGAGSDAYSEPRTAEPRTAANAASRAAGASTQPAETRGRRRASSAEEDPLTSAAFSLRPSGPVDGRSSFRAGGSRSGGPGPGSAGTYGGTSPGSPYPYAAASHGDPSSATQAMNAPPYGESYGYGSRGSAPAGDDPQRPNGTRSQARPTGVGQGGQGTRPPRQAYPTLGYPGQGGYPGDGQRAPYDPREGYRRLTQPR